MRRLARISTRHDGRPSCPAAVVAVVLGVGALAPVAAATAATSAKATSFTGRIVSGTRRYVNLRGAARLVLHARTGPTGALAFSLTLSAPSCGGQAIRPPRRCVALAGAVTGTAVSAPRIPDIGATFALRGQGHASTLGRVSASGTASGLGFIARGRFRLVLVLRRPAGSVKIDAQGPLGPGGSAPF